MMDNLRTKANSPFIKVLLAIIILSFVLTGVAGYMIGGLSNDAAKVNGQSISREQFQTAFSQERQSLQDSLGDKFSEIAGNEESMKFLRNQVLNNLINSTLMAEYANELNLSASDQQVKDAIFEMPVFQTNGKFDGDKYRQILAANNYSADNLAEQVRANLILSQLSDSFIKTDFALPSEVKTYAELVLQEREIRVATLSLADEQAKQTATEDEIKAYYNANQDSFIAPEKVQVSYVEIDATALPPQSVTDEEVKTYYEQNLKNYTQAEQKHYSMIQVASEKEANAIIDELKAGADFVALATEKSTDKLSAGNKGIIGWMEEASTPSEIVNANLTEKGQISTPIKSDSNFVIFRLDDIKPESIKPLDSVKDEIKNKLIQDKNSKQFYDLQQKVSEAATNDNESLASVEEVSGLKVVATDWFDKNNPPAALNYPKVINEIFSERLVDQNGSTGINSDVIDVQGDRAFVVRVSQYAPEQTQPLEAVKSQVETLVKRQKANAALKAEGEKLVAALKEGKGDTANIQFSAPEKVSRLMPQTPVIGAAMAMAKPADGKATYTTVRDEKDNLVIIQLDKVIPGKASDKELEQLTANYRGMMGMAVNEALIQNLRNNAKIEVINLD
ncbi:peptidylprolyl isomerase [Providencia stuartii]|uniref:peptidylprolyl isomerase n=1 Tax=Providencia stuartii TaxID=588 RepID=UPI0030F23C28